MTRGRTSSSLSLGARREKAKELFARGLTITEVSREIQVSPETAARYKKAYEAEIAEQAAANPKMLQDIVKNTFQALRELDQIRAEAWKRYELAGSDQARASFLNTSLKAQDQRAKLFQLFGVKAEYMANVAVIQRQQAALIDFLGSQDFCEADRTKIIDFITSQINMDDLLNLPTVDEPSRS